MSAEMMRGVCWEMGPSPDGDPDTSLRMAVVDAIAVVQVREGGKGRWRVHCFGSYEEAMRYAVGVTGDWEKDRGGSLIRRPRECIVYPHEYVTLRGFKIPPSMRQRVYAALREGD